MPYLPFLIGGDKVHSIGVNRAKKRHYRTRVFKVLPDSVTSRSREALTACYIHPRLVAVSRRTAKAAETRIGRRALFWKNGDGSYSKRSQ